MSDTPVLDKWRSLLFLLIIFLSWFKRFCLQLSFILPLITFVGTSLFSLRLWLPHYLKHYLAQSNNYHWINKWHLSIFWFEFSIIHPHNNSVKYFLLFLSSTNEEIEGLDYPGMREYWNAFPGPPNSTPRLHFIPLLTPSCYGSPILQHPPETFHFARPNFLLPVPAPTSPSLSIFLVYGPIPQSQHPKPKTPYSRHTKPPSQKPQPKNKT